MRKVRQRHRWATLATAQQGEGEGMQTGPRPARRSGWACLASSADVQMSR